MPSVCCIIPHYGPDSLLEKCIQSIKNIRISPEYIDSWDDNGEEICVINNNENNRYFTAAVNEGIEQNPGYDYYWLMNNDCIATPDIVDNALRCFEEIPEAGIVSCKNLLAENQDFIFWGGGRQMWPSGQHKQGYVSKGDCNERTIEEWATFSCVFIRGSLLRESGQLDPNMRHICSDADYCLRARIFGWQVLYEPTCVCIHEVGTSSKGGNEKLNSIMRNDKAWFHLKWVCNQKLFSTLTKYGA